MEETRYGLKITLPATYDEAVQQTTDALKAEGFGVLTEVDVAATLRAKLGVERPPLKDHVDTLRQLVAQAQR